MSKSMGTQNISMAGTADRLSTTAKISSYQNSFVKSIPPSPVHSWRSTKIAKSMFGFLFLLLTVFFYLVLLDDQNATHELWSDDLDLLIAQKANQDNNNAVTRRLFQPLEREWNGQILYRSDSSDYEWEHASHVFNPRYRKIQPWVILEAGTNEDVVRAVPFLAHHNISFCIKSGGHSYAGWSTCKGVVLSVTRLNSFEFNETSAMATFGPGLRDGMFLRESLIPNGYAGVIGHCSGVALSGFILGGGDGSLSRLYGLGADSAVEFQVVLFDGRLISANATHYSDLFWALRGAGQNNFGVVTQISYKLYPSQDNQLFCSASIPLNHVPGFLQRVGDLEPHIPGQMGIHSYGGGNCNNWEIGMFWFGDTDASLKKGESLITDILEKSLPTNTTTNLKCVRRSWYQDELHAQAGLSGNLLQSWGSFVMRNNSKHGLWDHVLQELIKKSCDNEYISVDIELWGGAIGQVPPSATAFYWRGALYYILCFVLVPIELEDAHSIFKETVDEMNKIWSIVSPSFQGSFPNVPIENLKKSEYLDMTWGGNLEQLQRVKAKYDPMNIFNHKQSINLPSLLS